MRWGGGALPKLKNTLYIFLYDGRKRCTSCPKEGEEGGGGGEVIWAMPERKHSFLHEVFPNVGSIIVDLQLYRNKSTVVQISLREPGTGIFDMAQNSTVNTPKILGNGHTSTMCSLT